MSTDLVRPPTPDRRPERGVAARARAVDAATGEAPPAPVQPAGGVTRAASPSPPVAPRGPATSGAPTSSPAALTRAQRSQADARARWLLGAMARVLQASEPQHAARALVLHLAATLGCQRVALGWQAGTAAGWRAASGPGTPLRLLALSDLARPADAPDLVQDLEAAMHEAAMAACSLSYPARRHDDVRPGLAHVQLGRALGASAVCSIPLGGRGQVLGALTLQRELGRPFTATEILRLEEAAAFLAPVLAQQFALPAGARAGALAGPAARATGWQRLQRARRHAPWAALAVALALGAWPVRHEVVATARVQGLNERQLPAPRDGYITAAHVRPGDSVTAGQTLLDLDTDTLVQDVRAAQATLDQAESAFSEALAKHDQGQVVTQLAKVDETRARLQQAQADLARSAVQAPAAGIVVSGDWSRSLGAPVKRGDVLHTLAPDGALRVKLWVDERDIADVQLGGAGALRLAASPGTAWPLTIERLTPVARVQDGRNGFDVDALLVPGPAGAAGATKAGAAPRPGLEGVARLDAGQRPWLQSQGQRAWRWLRLQWWSWLG